jgi:hypothetical protein
MQMCSIVPKNTKKRQHIHVTVANSDLKNNPGILQFSAFDVPTRDCTRN